MAWYHIYQYAEVKPGRGYRNLRNKALPIIRYEITDNPRKVVAVECSINRAHSIWLNAQDITLYRAASALIETPDQHKSKSRFARFLRRFNLTPWR